MHQGVRVCYYVVPITVCVCGGGGGTVLYTIISLMVLIYPGELGDAQ